MAYVAAILLVAAILFVLFKLVVAPAEETVDLRRGDQIALPPDPKPVCLFAEDEIQTFTNDQSSLLESAPDAGHAPADKGLRLKASFKKDGWVIVQLKPRSADWASPGKLHFLARGAGRPTAVRIVARGAGGEEFSCWHDTALAGKDWALLTIPFTKLEGPEGRSFAPKGIESLNVEIHTDRKLGVKDEEERELVLGGLWTSAGR